MTPGKGNVEVRYEAGSSNGDRTAWIVSYTGVSNEPRVIRQAAALIGAGWRVVVLGYVGHSPRPTEWHFVELPLENDYSRLMRFAMDVVRRFAWAATYFGPGDRVREIGAKAFHACLPRYRWTRRKVISFLKRRPDLRPQLVICHDYFTLDIGYGVATRAGAKFVVDCHEYARGQYMDNPYWVKYVRPYVTAFQNHFLARADAVTTVCEGIAELINREEMLKRPVRVIRSVPFRNIQPFRPTGESITVFYLGEIYYMRGLHKAIKSIPLWRPEFRFVMQGNVEPGYGERLMEIATELGVADRVEIRPPVPFNDIVPSANRIGDIGYFVHKDLSPQKRFVLPNKYFEYVMAGLALCVSDLPEMARLVRQYGFGRLVPRYDEQAIADVINSFDRVSIDEMKQRSLAAAEELNWDVEKRQMLNLYEEILK